QWWNECLHGCARSGLATVFPQSIGMAAAWDPALLEQVFTVASNEQRIKYHQARAEGKIDRYEGLTVWTPNINIFRDPRWGRGQETYGEDPYLTAELGKAVIFGLQGEPMQGLGAASGQYYDRLHACVKHFAVHSGPEWNRHTYDAKNISKRDLAETYL
ncbi:MAG: glycoside hydrolase family 3 protein, partial [Bacteroidales bacterium]|nr:glycoside hydrolase family 3 protein [Bacteroidales bacterium]